MKILLRLMKIFLSGFFDNALPANEFSKKGKYFLDTEEKDTVQEESDKNLNSVPVEGNKRNPDDPLQNMQPP